MIETLEQLHALYGNSKPASMVKVADRITPQYRAWIEASPFCALSTAGPEGLDASPRGDTGQVVYIEDERTLALPDRRGNDRLDSLRNIVRDPRVSLMLLVPGSGMVIRVNGTAQVTADESYLKKFEIEGNRPRSVILISIAEIYFQCSRAVMRAKLWSGEDKSQGLPSAGDILSAMSAGAEGGKEYDNAWPERAAKTLW